MAYLVHLQKFEGPLGLLLYLIRKEEMNIFDINVHEITRQYLEYIRMMKELDLEVAGEFVAMAATLIHIKSRMLLPQYNDEGEVVEQDDPRKELVQKLLEYQRYQEAGKKLYERPILGRDVFTTAVPFDWSEDGPGEVITEDEGLFSLIAAYRKTIKRMNKAVHNVRAKVQSISARVMEIRDRLRVGTRVTLRELLNGELLSVGGAGLRSQILITFLSLLELGRMGYVNLFQTEVYGDIHVETRQAIEGNVLERVQEFESDGAEAVAQHIIDEIVEEKIHAEQEDEHIVLEKLQGESQQLDLLAEVGVEPGASGADLIVNLIDSSIDSATDDEILAAELEIESVSGSVSGSVVGGVSGSGSGGESVDV